MPDPYFSATKLEWLLARVEGDFLFGTVESWLAWNLTGGAAHVTDATNASRTLLARLDPVEWDPELLDLFGVPAGVLPRIVPSSGVAGEAEIGGARVPLAGLAGDQQAALFGQACFHPGTPRRPTAPAASSSPTRASTAGRRRTASSAPPPPSPA